MEWSLRLLTAPDAVPPASQGQAKRIKVPVASISIKSGNPRYNCPKCGRLLRRLGRKGFFQKGVFPHFGYYPWECFFCRETRMLRARGRPVLYPVRENPPAESPELRHSPQHQSTPSPEWESSPSFFKAEASAHPKVEVSARPGRESSPPPKAEEEASVPAKSASLLLLKTEAALPLESASSQVLKVESSDFPKSGPLRSMKAESLHSPKRESLTFRKRDPSRSLNALPPVSEAALRRAIFVADSSPETAHLPVAPPVGA